MRLKVGKVKAGLHPSEVVVSVQTSSGELENLVVHHRSLLDEDSLEIGYPIRQEHNSYLVELPRETTTGAWRVWVPADAVVVS